jgi:hypothetical protein
VNRELLYRCGLEFLGSSRGRFFGLLPEPVYGIQISAGAGANDIGAGAFTGHQTAAAKVALYGNLTQRVFSAGGRLHMIFYEMSALMQDPIDCFHGGIDGSVTGR